MTFRTEARRVLVVRLDSTGDVLLSGPAVRAVSGSGAEVVLLCSPRGRAAAALLAGVRRITGASADYPGALLDVALRPGADHADGTSLEEDLPEPQRALAIMAAAGYRLPTGDDGRLAVRPPPAVHHLTGAGPYLVAPDALTEIGDLPQHAMHAELARRRVYLHATRWTSLGLSLIEAMALGVPVVALATTEAVAAVPPSAGVLATRVQTLVETVRELVSTPWLAREMGCWVRQVALRDFGLDGFLQHWDALLKEVSG
ncbi:MAG: glycosyltransferase [Pseudonocardiaceae bacterium]